MKVLFVYSGNSISGVNKIVENQARSLNATGIDIELLPIKGKGFRGYFKNIKKISKLLKRQKFDIIHAHYGLSGMVALFVRRKERLIVSFMGDDLVGSNRKNGSKKLWSLFLIIFNAIFARFFYDFTIVKSSEMERKLFKNTNYSLIPNGVDLEDFYPIIQSAARKNLDIDPAKKIVLFVSNPARTEKNFSLSASSVKALNDNMLSLTPIYNVPVDILNLYYNSANLLLLTSYHEGSPNVLKEAMACRCPIVSTNVGDVKWLFGDTPGHFITNFDSADVAEKIKFALEYSKIHGRTKGRERISDLGLDSDTVAGRIIEVYKKVLSIDD